MRPPVERRVGDRIRAGAKEWTAQDVVRASWDLKLCPATGLSWSSPCWWLLFGVAGGGKSTLALQIAAQCRKVVIASLEESPGPPMARRLTLAGMAHRRDVTILTAPSLDELVAAARDRACIVVDSISSSVFSPEDLRGLCDAGAELVIGVLHATKAGDYRGPTTFVHEADVVLSVAAGRWTSGKNRFGQSGLSGAVAGFDSDSPSNEVSP